MTKEKFCETMKNEVQKKIDDEVDVRIIKTTKNNGVERTGLTFVSKKSNLSPTIYLEELYQAYLDGMELGRVLWEITKIYRRAVTEKRFDMEKDLNFDRVSGRIRIQLVNAKTNEKLLEKVPHQKFLDLVKLYYLDLGTNENMTAVLVIRKEHLTFWDITEEQLFDIADKNMKEYAGMILEELCSFMYVATNKKRNLGASVVCDDSVLKMIYTKIGDGFFLLPSSIHEWIIVPKFHVDSSHALAEIVKDINETEVDAEEVLSNSVYCYNGDNIEVALQKSL